MKKLTPYQRVKRYRISHPDADNARVVVYVGKRNGTIIQKPCIKCGNKKSEAHHENYSKPLQIIWLCKKHHIEADRERRQREKDIA